MLHDPHRPRRAALPGPRIGARRLLLAAGWMLLAPAFTQAQTTATPRDPFLEPMAVGSTLQILPEQVARWRDDARALEDGNGVPKDLRLAAQLYCRAARFGDAEAQFSLAWMLLNGRGVPRDDAHAAHLFAAAAEQGIVQAQNMLQSLGAPRGEVPPCLRSPEADRPVAAAAASPVAAKPAAAPTARPAPPRNAPESIVRFVDLVAPEYKLEPQLVLAVMATESNFNPLAVSPKNAHGLMQLIPETAARFNVRNLKDPVDNMRGGMAYLRWLLAYFEGDVMLALAAYNAGERAVEQYRGVPPYAETRQYVLRILAAIGGRLSHPFDPNVTPPSQVVAQRRAP
ncbi:MAG: transglycosylase SLT domain-containing protein [Burkholderiaceae bacterium]